MKSVIKNLASSFNFLIIITLMGFGSTTTAQSNNPETKGVAYPLVTATIAVTSSCKKGRTCGGWAYSLTKVNAVTITNTSTAWYPNLQYSIYANSTGSGSPFVTFVCGQNPVTYASTLLPNGQTYYVKLKDVNSSNSTGYAFTIGSFNGQGCTPTPVSTTEKQ